jgi:protein ImuB
MRLADARALVPDLVTTSGEPQADQRLIGTIADWCDRYTPWVAIDPLGGAMAEEGTEACSAGGFGGDAGLLLDVTGCAHLFGPDEAGERALLADLVSRLARHDFACRAAMADTAGAAWALARYAERQADLFCPRHGQRAALASLPVEGLRLEATILETFVKLGLRHIGDLYPLPRAPLARRFGDLPLIRLDQALGVRDEVLEPRRVVPAFRTRLSFVEPVGRPEDIAAATSRLLAALCRQFELAGVGARRLEISLYRVDGSVDRAAIGTSRPNRDNPKLMKLFEERLGELDPGLASN